MSDDPTPGYIANIRTMREIAKRDDCPDMIATELVQSIADIVDRARGVITDEDCAMLLGIGSTFVKQSEREIMASLQTFNAIGKGKS